MNILNVLKSRLYFHFGRWEYSDTRKSWFHFAHSSDGSKLFCVAFGSLLIIGEY